MRKNISKLMAMAIGISVMSGSIVPALATDNVQQTTTTNVQIINGKPLLSLDDAIKSAISNSEILALDEEKISYQDKVNGINEDLDDATSVSNDKEDFDEDTHDNELNSLKQQKDFDEDKLIQDVTKKYNDIVTSQIKIDKATKDLEIKNKLLSNAKLKADLGLLTSNELKSTELQIQKAENEQKLNENLLNNAQYNFKVLTGEDLAQYSLEKDIKYDAFKIEGSVDEYLDNVIGGYLKYKTELIKINKDYYNDSDRKVTDDDVNTAKNTSDNATPPVLSDGVTIDQYMNAYNKYQSDKSAYANTLAARLTYLSTKLTIEGNETNLNESKKQLKETLRQVYTSLLSKEDEISYIKNNIELANKQLSDAKLKYDLGMMTKLDYDTLVINSQDLDIQLRTAIDTYNTYKEQIQKPWLLNAGQ